MLLFCLAKDCEGTLFDGGEDRRTMMLGSSSSSSSSHAMVLSCVSPLSSPAVILQEEIEAEQRGSAAG